MVMDKDNFKFKQNEENFYKLDLQFNLEDTKEDKDYITIKGLATRYDGKNAYGFKINQGAFGEDILKLKDKDKNGYKIKMLNQHNPYEPIGLVEDLEDTKKGLKITAKIFNNTTLGKDIVMNIKNGLLDSFSIGFEFIEFNEDKKELNLGRLREISVVTFPASIGSDIKQVLSELKSLTTYKEVEQFLTNNYSLSKSLATTIVSMVKSIHTTELEAKQGLGEPNNNEDKELKELLESIKADKTIGG